MSADRSDQTLDVPVQSPGPFSSAAVRLAARALPGGPVRARYRQEFLAELYGLDPGRCRRHALGVLSRCYALRANVGTSPRLPAHMSLGPLAARRPLLCRVNVHHKWRQESTSDGQRYTRCARCGKDGIDIDMSGGMNPGAPMGLI